MRPGGAPILKASLLARRSSSRIKSFRPFRLRVAQSLTPGEIRRIVLALIPISTSFRSQGSFDTNDGKPLNQIISAPCSLTCVRWFARGGSTRPSGKPPVERSVVSRRQKVVARPTKVRQILTAHGRTHTLRREGQPCASPLVFPSRCPSLMRPTSSDADDRRVQQRFRYGGFRIRRASKGPELSCRPGPGI